MRVRFVCFIAALVAVLLVGSEAVQSVSADTATSKESSRGVTINSISFKWGMSKAEASSRYHGKLIKDTDGMLWLRQGRNPSGSLFPIDWIKLQFCGERLCGIHRRLNNPDKKTPGFAASIIKQLRAEFGEETSDTWVDSYHGNHWKQRIVTWVTRSAKIESTHQASEFYVEIEYIPRRSMENLSEETKRKIWSAYDRYEPLLGKEEALRRTAKDFKVTVDDVFRVQVEGLEQGW